MHIHNTITSYTTCSALFAEHSNHGDCLLLCIKMFMNWSLQEQTKGLAILHQNSIRCCRTQNMFQPSLLIMKGDYQKLKPGHPCFDVLNFYQYFIYHQFRHLVCSVRYILTLRLIWRLIVINGRFYRFLFRTFITKYRLF